jgi:hypothetical protein
LRLRRCYREIAGVLQDVHGVSQADSAQERQLSRTDINYSIPFESLRNLANAPSANQNLSDMKPS